MCIPAPLLPPKTIKIRELTLSQKEVKLKGVYPQQQVHKPTLKVETQFLKTHITSQNQQPNSLSVLGNHIWFAIESMRQPDMKSSAFCKLFLQGKGRQPAQPLDGWGDRGVHLARRWKI